MTEDSYFPNFRFATALILTTTVGLIASGSVEAQGLPRVSPEASGMQADCFPLIADLIEEAILDKKLPGCVVCIGRHGKIAWLEAFGDNRLEPQREAMTTNA
ncbi:MAG: hypothetical protein ACK53L_15560, partial [Pirellulaceae bacterium]